MAYGLLAEVIKEDIFEGYLQAMRKVCGILNSGGSHPKTVENLYQLQNSWNRCDLLK